MRFSKSKWSVTGFRSWGYPMTNYLCLAFLAAILVIKFMTEGLRISVYLIPVWLLVLFIGYRFRGAPEAAAA